MRYLPRRAFYVSGGGKLKRNYPWWFCLLPLPLVWWAAVAVASHWQTGGLNSVLAALNAALAAPFALRWTEHSARFLLLFTLTYAVAAVVLVSDKCNTRPGAEHGSACWGDVSALNRKYRDKHGTNLLLTKHFQIGVDGYKHKHNTNVLVIGGSGAGKTRTYAVPNVLQAGCSMVITDPKAEILRKTGAFLLAQGYEVRVFDLIDPSASFCYNPFCYVQSDKDVLQLIADLIQNTTPPNAHENDPFWSKAETALLQALMLYLIHEAPADEQNFAMVMEMIAAAEVREDDADYQSPLDILFERLEMREPDSIACKQYRIFKQAAGKTARSILVSVGVRLAAFNLPQIARLTMLSIDILPVPTDEATRQLQNTLLGVETNAANWQRRQNANNNFSAAIPYDMELQRKETKEMLDDLTTRDQRMMFGLVTLVHLADSKRQLDSDTETLLSVGRKHLCQLSTLRWQQRDGLDTVLPYGVRRIQALRTLTTESTAVLIPFRAQEIMQAGGIYYGQNAVSKNRIVADRRLLLNGNSFRLGVSGSGKSMSAKEEIVQIALATEDDILILDPESEFGHLTRALGGEVIQISAASDTHINALDMDKEYGDDRNPIIAKSEFVLSLFEQLAGSLTAAEKSILGRCTELLYKPYLDRGCTGTPPTLKDFYRLLKMQPETEAQGLALSSELFITGTLNTFARHTNVNTRARIIDYDIRELGEQLMPLGMLVTLDAIYNRVIQNWKAGRRTWIVCDEFYLLFRYEYSSNFFYKLWKRIRKYNGLITGLTQNVDELLRSDTARLMLANSEFLIMLNQSATDRGELAKLLNISDTQLGYITNVPAGCGLIRCAGNLVPFTNSFPTDTKLYRLMTTKPDERLKE